MITTLEGEHRPGLPACALLPIMRRRAGLILGVVLLLAGTAGIAGWRWWDGRAPYGPEALNAAATLRLVDQATADAALAPVNAEVATDPGDQILLGNVTWTTPPGSPPDTSLRIVVVDKRSHLLPGFLAVTSPHPQNLATGMDGSLDRARERYPWLAGTATNESSGSIVTAGMDTSPVTFQTVLHASAPATTQDMLVALICVAPDGRVHWAQRLLN
jgi:hypothetical protein